MAPLVSDVGTADALLPFVGLASEWEDHPTHGAEFDHDITLAMERLLTPLRQVKRG